MNLRAIPSMLSMLSSMLRGVAPGDLEKIKTITQRAYPSVIQVGTCQLAKWMEEPGNSLLLIDVRTAEEFAVSQLRDAIHLETADSILKAVEKEQPLRTVLYCAVGFRSSRLAERLSRLGVQNVLNLEGSIFQWANEGRTVYQQEKPV